MKYKKGQAKIQPPPPPVPDISWWPLTRGCVFFLYPTQDRAIMKYVAQVFKQTTHHCQCHASVVHTQFRSNYKVNTSLGFTTGVIILRPLVYLTYRASHCPYKPRGITLYPGGTFSIELPKEWLQCMVTECWLLLAGSSRRPTGMSAPSHGWPVIRDHLKTE